MVEPVTITAAAKGFEGATSLGVEAAKGAAESLQASAIHIGEGFGGAGVVKDSIGGTQMGMGSSTANFSSSPMPEGFVPDPLGGTQHSVANNAAEKTGAPQESKSLIDKMGDYYKAHKSDINTIRDKLHTVAQVEKSVNHIGTDLMGTDANRYNPETNNSVPRWGRW